MGSEVWVVRVDVDAAVVDHPLPEVVGKHLIPDFGCVFVVKGVLF